LVRGFVQIWFGCVFGFGMQVKTGASLKEGKSNGCARKMIAGVD